MSLPPGLVLLHGFTHTGTSWQPVLDALGNPDDAVAPDIRGHGSASERQPVHLSAVMEDLARLLPERCRLVGYSMGGRLAMHLAMARPGQVERLVLIGASPGLSDRSEREARGVADEELARWIEGVGIEEFAERWARTPVLAGLPPAVAERVHQDRLRNTPAGLARALRGLGTGTLPSLWDRLGELTMPATLIVGERDHKFRGIAQEMADSIPQAAVVTVPGVGHAVHLEAPAAVAEIIADTRAT